MNDNIHLKKYLKKRSIHKVGKPHKQIQRNNYKFFIVIPCYNEFEYIFDTLESINIQNQNLLNDSLVVVIINHSIDDVIASLTEVLSIFSLVARRRSCSIDSSPDMYTECIV